MKCKYCEKDATRLHARHDTGALEYLCETRYQTVHESFKEISECIEAFNEF